MAVSNVTVQYPIAPTVQIGGVSVGTGYQTSYYLGGSPVGIVAPDFSIDATPFDGLDGAVVSVDLPGSPSTELSVDTSGTNLSASYFGSGLYLVGHDTAEHYEQVLRSILFTPSLTQPGITRQVALTLDAGGHASPPVTTLVTVLSPPAPLVDLNGPAPGRNYAGTVEVGGPATEIVAADALSIDSPVWNVLSGRMCMYPMVRRDVDSRHHGHEHRRDASRIRIRVERCRQRGELRGRASYGPRRRALGRSGLHPARAIHGDHRRGWHEPAGHEPSGHQQNHGRGPATAGGRHQRRSAGQHTGGDGVAYGPWRTSPRK